jgi:hypothetical protein
MATKEKVETAPPKVLGPSLSLSSSLMADQFWRLSGWIIDEAAAYGDGRFAQSRRGRARVYLRHRQAVGLQRLMVLQRDERGQTTAWMVGISIVLFGLMAFAIDFGFFFHARRVVQNAADPGALAGAAYLEGCSLGSSGFDPEGKAEEYADWNLTGKTFNGSADVVFADHRPDSFKFTDEFGTASFDAMYVRVDRDQRYIFGRFLGLSSAIVPAEAEAACVYGNSFDGICPFWIEGPDISNPEDHFGLELFKVYQFKDGAGGGPNHGFLGLYGKNANDINNAIANGCTGPFDDKCSDGETVIDGATPTCTEVGVKSSAFNAIGDQFWYEGTIGYNTTDHCNIPFDPDPFFGGSPPAFVDPDISQEEIDERLGLVSGVLGCNIDPNSTCSTCAVEPNNVSGRIWPIAIVDIPDSCHGWCDVEFTHVALMYVACAKYSSGGGKSPCDDQPAGQAGVYGMFIGSVPVDIPIGGVGTNPNVPMHVILIR